MNMRDLIPWTRAERSPRVFGEAEQHPIFALHREMNRLFDDVFRGFDGSTPLGGLAGWNTGWPSVEVSEKDNEIRVVAEVPGLDEKEIEVLLDDGVLCLRGEKRSESETKDRHFSERFYGRFERRIPLGYEVDEDKVKATFKNGVLTVTLPKSANAEAKAKRIAISNGS